MSEEAKPKACPWCQQMPQLIFRDDGRIGWRGNCPACESDKTAPPEVMYRAIENWNRRPLEDALAAERDAALARVASLEAALREIRDVKLNGTMSLAWAKDTARRELGEE